MLLCAAVWFSVIIEQCKTQRPLKIYLSDALNAMVVNLDYIMFNTINNHWSVWHISKYVK